MKNFLGMICISLLASCGAANNSASSIESGAVKTNLVRLVLKCSTADKKYSVYIVDNQGTGPDRSSHLSASIVDTSVVDLEKVVGSYAPLTLLRSSGSISFGHGTYVDTATNGNKFSLALPSTNTPYAVSAVLSNGKELNYGHRFAPKAELALTCGTI